MAQKTRGRTTAQIIADKEKKRKRKEKKQSERTKEIILKKNIEQGLPTERQPSKKPEPTIPTAEPEVIKLGEEPKVGRQEDDSILLNLPEPEKKKDFVKSALLGTAIGAVAGAAIFAGGLGVAALATKAATSAAITSGFAQQAAVTAGFKATAPRAVVPITNKLGQMTINLKTIGLSKGFLSKAFSVKAMALYGAWASSIFLGRWGQAEAPEGIMIPIRDLIKIAETPEDWAFIDEKLQLAKEISDTSIWEEILLWSPFSAVTGIMNKVEGVAAGVEILTETTAEVQEIQSKVEETGETEFAAERRKSDEAATQRRLREQELDSEYFRLIREKKFEEADELLQSRLKEEE